VLIECADSTDPLSLEEQARTQFMLCFAAIKAKLDASDSAKAVGIVPVLVALYKQNLAIGIAQCISMGCADKNGVRAAFISAVASVFRVRETKVVDAEEAGEATLINLLFAKDSDLLKLVSMMGLSARRGAFAGAFVETLHIRGIVPCSNVTFSWNRHKWKLPRPSAIRQFGILKVVSPLFAKQYEPMWCIFEVPNAVLIVSRLP
jgi:hypothetical protein